jgi:hypothetical protein|tara:strand:+ start:33 stop:1046 length:1014 start_codon:yes stop_codon:yes gene_type:complete
MPDIEEKKTVDIDTSGPGAEISVAEEKDEAVVETGSKEQETETKESNEETNENNNQSDDSSEKSTEQSDVQASETKKEDEKLEEYSKGVQGRIAKLTRKMREAERREKAALDYAKAVDEKRIQLESRFKKSDSEYLKKLESNVNLGLDSAKRELATAIETGDAKSQVDINKRIAELSFENARLQEKKQNAESMAKETPVKLSDGGKLPEQTPSELPEPDPRAEDWASNNTWFGQDRAMTFTAFEIHKDLVEKEGFDPKSNEYYSEIDKRIRVDFPSKFGNNEKQTTSKPVQSVASANRSVKPGRKTVRLTSSQVAIAKKLGVPLEEYAKQLKITKEV